MPPPAGPHLASVQLQTTWHPSLCDRSKERRANSQTSKKNGKVGRILLINRIITYNPCKWTYKWITDFITPISAGITSFMTGFGTHFVAKILCWLPEKQIVSVKRFLRIFLSLLELSPLTSMFALDLFSVSAITLPNYAYAQLGFVWDSRTLRLRRCILRISNK